MEIKISVKLEVEVDVKKGLPRVGSNHQPFD